MVSRDAELGDSVPTLLCIDDHTYGLAVIIETLRAHRYTVIAATDTQNAFDLLAERIIDAVLLNCHAPGETSRMAPLLRKLQPNTPIIMMSGYCVVPCPNLRLSDACIQKGESDQVMLRTVETTLCSRRFGLCRSVAA
jgi:CheY-like chemotaxis protein